MKEKAEGLDQQRRITKRKGAAFIYGKLTRGGPRMKLGTNTVSDPVGQRET